MPSAMIHLEVGRKIAAKLFGSVDAPKYRYYVGTLAPDCVTGPRELKDRLHLRDISPEQRREKLAEMALKTSSKDEYEFGCLVHLFTDLCWDEGPQTVHHNSYTGEQWFIDYRHEISLASAYMYRHCNWTEKMWSSMLSLDFEKECSSIPAYTPNAIYDYLTYNSSKQAEHYGGISPAFPPELVEEFTTEAAERFIEFYKQKGKDNA